MRIGQTGEKKKQLCEKGHVAATICGAPCETFSAARHVAPPADLSEAEKHRWPRPLRSFAQLFGLSDLRPGSAFMLQATMVCIWHVVFGGLFLSEHPAPPGDDSKASIWTSAHTGPTPFVRRGGLRGTLRGGGLRRGFEGRA